MPRPKNGIRVLWLNRCVLGSSDDLSSAAMTTAYDVSSPPRGRRVKFTPEVIESIKKLVAQGINRHEIANRLGVTVGSLQVTCSRLGISLRRIIQTNGSGCHTLDVNGRTIPTPCSGIAHVREQKVSQRAARAAPVVQVAITMRCHGKEKTSDIPLPSPAIAVLALEATSRNLNIVDLMGQVLVAAINNDMIPNILR